MYYTVWILVTPLFDDDFWMQNYFPDRVYGIMPTSLLAYMILAYMFTFAGIVEITQTESYKLTAKKLDEKNNDKQKRPLVPNSQHMKVE